MEDGCINKSHLLQPMLASQTWLNFRNTLYMYLWMKNHLNGSVVEDLPWKWEVIYLNPGWVIHNTQFQILLLLLVLGIKRKEFRLVHPLSYNMAREVVCFSGKLLFKNITTATIFQSFIFKPFQVHLSLYYKLLPQTFIYGN